MFCLFGHRPGASEVGAGEPANFADIEKGILEAEIDNFAASSESLVVHTYILNYMILFFINRVLILSR